VVKRLLREAQRRGLKLGVVSGGQRDAVDAVLRGAGLEVGRSGVRGACRHVAVNCAALAAL
jgi:phosphoglycolate phosphatase-like HAD superfamily hydrolase